MRGRVNVRELAVFYGGICLGALLVFSVLAYYAAGVYEKSSFFYQSDKALLKNISAYKGSVDDLTVVILGNSRMRVGFEYGVFPEKMLVSRNGKKIHIVQYSHNIAAFSVYSELLPDILASQPDILVVQDQVLTSAFAENNFFYGASLEMMGVLSNIYHQRTLQEEWENIRYDQEIPCVETHMRGSLQERISFIAARDNHKIEDNPSLDEARVKLAEAVEQGIRVVIVDLPSLEEAVTHFGVKPYMVNTYGLDKRPSPRELLPQLYDRVDWVDFPQQLPSEMYCDIGHFNAKGRQIFTDWFIDYLIEAEGRPPSMQVNLDE